MKTAKSKIRAAKRVYAVLRLIGNRVTTVRISKAEALRTLKTNTVPVTSYQDVAVLGGF